MNCKQITPLILALCCAACSQQTAAVEEDSSKLPPQHAFEGQVNKDLVGEWKSKGGESLMELREDGSSTFETKVATPGGAQQVKVDGKWLAKDATLMIQDASGPQTKVIAYTFKVLGPKELELSTSFPAMKTPYTRVK
jgi:hypothetical protein